MRRRRDLQSAKASKGATDEITAARRYRRLCNWTLTAEPAPDVADRIRTERDRIDKSRSGPVARLERLEHFLAELDVLDEAEAFADRLEATARIAEQHKPPSHPRR